MDLDTMPQRGCPTCGITSKTAVLWPKTTPAQVPLALAKTPVKRPEKGGKNFGQPTLDRKVFLFVFVRRLAKSLVTNQEALDLDPPAQTRAADEDELAAGFERFLQTGEA